MSISPSEHNVQTTLAFVQVSENDLNAASSGIFPHFVALIIGGVLLVFGQYRILFRKLEWVVVLRQRSIRFVRLVQE